LDLQAITSLPDSVVVGSCAVRPASKGTEKASQLGGFLFGDLKGVEIKSDVVKEGLS